MITNRTISITRRTVTMAFALLLFAVAFLAAAHPAGAIPNNNNNGDDPIPHNAAPIARFTISPNPAIAGQLPLAVAHIIPGGGVLDPVLRGSGDVVTFDASASSDDHKVTNYEWDLDGNGTYETHGAVAKIERKQFFSTGTFTIRLRVSDAAGLKGVVSHPLVVRHAPHAAISASVAVPLVGQQVTYSAAGSTGDPGIAKYDWDLDGNGTFETATGTTPSAATSYQSAGPRTVAVRVTDTIGTTAVASVNEVVNQAPIAAFTAAPSPAFVGEVVHFDGSSSSDDDPIADYAWDLDGNGTFETDTKAVPTTTMTYAAAQTVTVRLRVTDSHGAQNTVARSVVVNPAPVVTTKDTTAPKVTITPSSVKISRLGNIAIKVTCPKTERSCSGRLSLTRTLRAHTSKLGNGAFRIGGGQTATVHMHLSKATRKLVKRVHTLRSQATAVATDAAGNSATTKATVKITR